MFVRFVFTQCGRAGRERVFLPFVWRAGSVEREREKREKSFFEGVEISSFFSSLFFLSLNKPHRRGGVSRHSFSPFLSLFFVALDGLVDVARPVEQERGKPRWCGLVSEGGICDGVGAASSSRWGLVVVAVSSPPPLDLWPRRQGTLFRFCQARASSRELIFLLCPEVALPFPAEHAPRRRRARTGDG